jgi:integrase
VNDYITTYHSDEFPNFFNFINKAIKVPQTGKVHKKEPLTLDEYNLICNTLEEQKEWQKLCWIKFVYNSGCRKEEARQMLKEIANYDPIITIKSFKNKETGLDEEKRIVKYITHDVRCKGKGKTGNVRQLMFDEDTMKYIKLWIEERKDDDCPYLFVQKIEKTGVTRQLGEGSFNKWLNKISSMIGGKRLHPHLLRSSKATNAVIHEGKSIESVQSLLGHKSSNTTEIYVVRDKSEDADELFM